MAGWWLLAFWGLGLIPFIGVIAGIAQFIVVGCLDGTMGSNDFGPDPKTRRWQYNDAPEDRLLKLAKLREMGIISEEEYEEKRRKLLAEI